MKQQYGVMVDGFSGGNLLAKEFLKQGVALIHVTSSQDVPEYFKKTYNDAHYTDRYSVSAEHTVAQIAELIQAKYAPSFVISGAESGVIVANQMSNLMQLNSANAKEAGVQTRNKYAMIQQLEKHGLPHINSLLTKDYAEAIAWKDKNGLDCIVVKPLDGVASVGVHFCYTPEEVKTVFDTLLNKKNVLGSVNEHLLVQEKLDGLQYIVNTVSIDNQHYITDLWVDNRKEIKNANYVGDYEELIDLRSEVASSIKNYTFKVLAALGVSNGPAHTEIMLHKGKPILIETASRIQGSICDDVLKECLGHSQITLTVMRYAQPESFNNYIKQDYAIDGSVISVLLIAYKNFVLGSDVFSNKIKDLKTFHSAVRLPGAGDTITPTIDLVTSPGIVYLWSDKRENLFADYDEIRNLEKEYL